MCESIRLVLKYFGTCLLCIFLSHTEVFGALKSEFFLQQDAIQGSVDEGPAEYLMQEDPELSPLDELSPMYADAVLGGNYPVNFQNKKKNKDKDSDDLGEKTMTPLKSRSFFLDPLKDVILSSIGNVISSITGEVNRNESASANMSIPTQGDFLKRLLECGRKMVLCSISDVFNVQCYLHCLFAAHPLGNAIMGSVQSFLTTLCMPLGTILDEGIGLIEKNFKGLKTVNHFITLFSVGPDSLERFARLFARALQTLIIKYLKLEGTIDLKVTINALVTTAKMANQGFNSEDVSGDHLMNRGCSRMDSIDAVQQLVGAIYKGAKLADTVLSGLWTMKKISILIEAKTLRNLIKAVNYGLSILIGAKCNIIEYALTGQMSECQSDEENSATVQSTVDLFLPEVGSPEVCGSTPYIPAYMLDDIFPPVFGLPSTTTTAEPKIMTGSDDGKEEMKGRSLGKAAMSKFGWLDDLLRTLNLEYDD